MSKLNLSLTADQLTELEDLIARTKRPEVRRRAHIVLLLSTGDRPSDMSRELGLSRKTIYNVAHRFELHGIDGLYDRLRNGRPGKANEHYWERLEEVLARDPADYGYPDLGWTVRLIQKHMTEETGMSLSPARLKVLLHHLGYAYKSESPRIDSLLPIAPNEWRALTQWLALRDGLKKTQPARMFRPYFSWVKIESG
jgi:transposase